MSRPAAPFNLVIFGVGAMGMLFGSRLNSLTRVTLFGRWADQIETVRRTGLTVIRPDGSQSHHWLRVVDDLRALPAADLVLLLVKSSQTGRAAGQAAAVLRPNGLALTLQNGLGNLEILAQAVGQERAGLGVSAQGAAIVRPGQLRYAGTGPTHLALTPGREERIKQAADLFNRAGLETDLVDQPDSLVWAKLAINAGINPLTALLEVPNGVLADYEPLRRTMAAAAGEAAAVAAALGIQLPFADAAQRALEVSRATAGNTSSMLQDIRRGAPTEIDAICGAISRSGRQTGRPTPVNDLLWRLIKEKEAGRLALDPQRVDLGTFDLYKVQP